MRHQLHPSQFSEGARNRSGKNCAFTLTELLVVLAIIGILASLLLPTLARAKDKAIRIQCLSNIKQLDLGIIMYAHDNHDQFPVMVGDNEPYDLPLFMVPLLEQNGVTRDVLYDPGYPALNNDYNWNDTDLTRDIGYVLTFAGPASWLADTNQNPDTRVSDPSSRVLVAGMVLSDVGQDQTDAVSRASYNYTHVPVDANPSQVQCPHLKGDFVPAGDNVAMMDGSAHWRKFTDMIPRNSNTNTLSTGTVVCWW